MSSDTDRPLLVWTTCHPWIERVVSEVRPPEFDVAFCDLDDREQVEALLPKAFAIVCLTLDADQVALLDNCRLVMHNGVGYDGIDRAALAARGIPLAITPAMTAEGVAEHVFMLILGLSRQLPAVMETMAEGGWGMLGWREGSHNVAYKTLGIVGLGRIGRRVAHLAHAFGCEVLFNDIVEAPAELVSRYGLQAVALDELLERSDIVTLHVPLTDATNRMISEAEIARMPAGAMLINASRGPVVDLGAVEAALVSGHLGAAGLDVFDPEPPAEDSPLRTMPNVICTPHIASGTVERQYAINRAQFANAARVLAGQAPTDLIP